MRGRARSRGVVVRACLAMVLTALCAALAAPAIATAAEDLILTGFESPDALKGATLLAPEIDSVRVTETFAGAGQASMAFDIGAFNSRAGTVFPRVWLNVGSTLPDHP
jgi:hypothetical protein